MYTESNIFGMFKHNNGTIKNLTIVGNYNVVSGGIQVASEMLSNYNLNNHNLVQMLRINDPDPNEYDMLIYNMVNLNGIGGIVGINSGKIENCTSNIRINVHVKTMESELLSYKTTNYIIEMIAGDNAAARAIGEGYPYLYIGGISGASSGEIIKCTNKGNITVTTEIDNDFCIGGIVGGSDYDLQISNCVNQGNIKVPNSHINDIFKRNFSRHIYRITESRNTGDLVYTQTNQDVCSVVGGIKGSIMYETDGASSVNQAIRDVMDGVILSGVAMENIDKIKVRLERLLAGTINESNLNIAINDINQIANNTKFNTLVLLNGTITELSISCGANGGQNILISLPNLTSEGLNLSSTSTKGDIEVAIQTVKDRSLSFGALINRFISTAKNLQAEEENLQ